MEISKLDAAKRQLDTAIILFFKQADPVSIHTLAAAAHQVLRDIGKTENIKSFLKDSGLIRKEYEKEYLTIISEAENFFKHADKDPHKLLQFNAQQTESLLLDAVEMYMQITKEMPEDMSIYRVWFLANHPEIGSPETKKEIDGKGLSFRHFQSKTKLEFFRSMKDALLTSKQF